MRSLFFCTRDWLGKVLVDYQAPALSDAPDVCHFPAIQPREYLQNHFEWNAAIPAKNCVGSRELKCIPAFAERLSKPWAWFVVWHFTKWMAWSSAVQGIQMISDFQQP